MMVMSPGEPFWYSEVGYCEVVPGNEISYVLKYWIYIALQAHHHKYRD